jgi:hypothetical protein
VKNLLIIMAFLFLGLVQISCSGDECAASANFIDDIDSDCVDDADDNCVGTFNPDQFDGDDDDIGAACDPDDTDEGSVALAKPSLANPATTASLEQATGKWQLVDQSCSGVPPELTITPEDVVQTKISFLKTRKGLLVDKIGALRCRLYFENDEISLACIATANPDCLGTYVHAK